MKTYKFEPAKFEEQEEGEKKKAKRTLADFEGHIVLIVPSFDQRMSYMEDCNVEIDEKGVAKGEKNALSQLRKMVSVSKGHYKEVKITHKPSGEVYKSFDDLSLDPACDRLLSVVGGLVVRGFTPSKH